MVPINSRKSSVVKLYNVSFNQVVADFDAQNDFEMSVKAGDVVTVTAKLNELWLEGECDGHVGEWY